MDIIKRAVHIDFHTMPGVYDFGKDWNAKEFAKTLHDSHVTQINAFAQCNLGFSYYPTKVGVMYPELEFDMFGELLEECHKLNIKVCAYISAGLNHEQSRRHAEWCQMDQEGRIIFGDRTANFFRLVCYNTGYLDYLIETVKEVLSYPVDGLFLDSMVIRPCYCSSCTEKMISSGLDIQNKDDVYKFATEITLNAAKIIRSIVPQDKFLYFNGIPWEEKLNSHVELECLPGGAWGYDFFPARAAYGRTLSDKLVYMTGRFQASWADFGGFKTEASLENDFYDALLNGFQVSVGDHLHPAGSLEKHVYNSVSKLFKKFEKFEKWTDSAKYIADIALIRNKDAWKREVYWESLNGAARMLGELKYTFDIINEDADFKKYKLIILPDEVEMSQALTEKLKAHIAEGKPVLSTGFSGLDEEHKKFALSNWDFVSFEGHEESERSYYNNLHPDANDSSFRWAMYAKGIKMTAKPSAVVWGNHIKAYFERHWDGMHGYFYTPPEKESGYTSVAKKDNICHISFEIFKAYFKYAATFHKDLIALVIKSLLPEPLIKTHNIPSTARVGLTGTNEYKILHVKVTRPEMRGQLQVIEEHDVMPEGSKVFVRGEYNSVKQLPDGSSIDFEIENGYTVIKLPEVTGAALFLIENL